MKTKALLTITGIFFLLQSATSQMKQDVAAYIEKYKAIALEEMVRCKIPASVTLAQGLHESSYGKSKLSTEANNHFGIKCKEEWDGKKFFQNDDAPNECFRVYDHAEDSYADHSDFLITRTRYAGLFELPITDYKAWAHGLKSSGYATNPKYAEILIKTIEDNNLAAFDQQGLAMIAEKERQFAPNTPTEQPVAIKTEAPQKQQPATVSPVATIQPREVKHNSVTKTSAPVTEKEKTAVSNTTTEQIVFAQTETTPKHQEPNTKSPTAAVTVREVKHNTFTKASGTEFVTVHDDATKKEFQVNGTKAIKAEGTVDPLSIAYNYQIQYVQVLAFNDMNEGDKFKDGENIFLQSKRSKGNEPIYTVAQGESMRSIAQKLGIKLKDLYLKNVMVANDQPYPGETIYLQEKRPGPPKTMAYSDFLKSQNTSSNPVTTNTSTANASTDNSVPAFSQTTAQYKVEPSDTLYSIAKKFNTTVQQLRTINNLENTDLHPGQTLVVSK